MAAAGSEGGVKPEDVKVAAGGAGESKASTPAVDHGHGKNTETPEQEKARYSVLHSQFMKLPFNANRVKRTGWTKAIEGYKVLCFGNSSEDWMKIVGCFFCLYVGVVFFFWGLLEATLATDEGKEALWIFLGLGIIGWGVLFSVVAAGDKARSAAAAATSATGPAAA